MLSIILLNVTSKLYMLNVIILNAIMLSVVVLPRKAVRLSSVQELASGGSNSYSCKLQVQIVYRIGPCCLAVIVYVLLRFLQPHWLSQQTLPTSIIYHEKADQLAAESSRAKQLILKGTHK